MTETIKATAKKDCRGVSCPMNMVYTKVGLSKLTAGDILEVLLDDGPPINNVPGSVQREGHEILSKHQLEDGSWQLMIRKA